MGNQYGSTTNSETVAAFPCPVCGADVGVACTVVDKRGVVIQPSMGVMHAKRAEQSTTRMA